MRDTTTDATPTTSDKQKTSQFSECNITRTKYGSFLTSLDSSSGGTGVRPNPKGTMNCAEIRFAKK